MKVYEVAYSLQFFQTVRVRREVPEDDESGNEAFYEIDKWFQAATWEDLESDPRVTIEVLELENSEPFDWGFQESAPSAE